MGEVYVFFWQGTNTRFFPQGRGLLSEMHIKFHVSWRGFSNIASDWLAAVMSGDQIPGLKIFVN